MKWNFRGYLCCSSGAVEVMGDIYELFDTNRVAFSDISKTSVVMWWLWWSDCLCIFLLRDVFLCHWNERKMNSSLMRVIELHFQAASWYPCYGCPCLGYTHKHTLWVCVLFLCLHNTRIVSFVGLSPGLTTLTHRTGGVCPLQTFNILTSSGYVCQYAARGMSWSVAFQVPRPYMPVFFPLWGWNNESKLIHVKFCSFRVEGHVITFSSWCLQFSFKEAAPQQLPKQSHWAECFHCLGSLALGFGHDIYHSLFFPCLKLLCSVLCNV